MFVVIINKYIYVKIKKLLSFFKKNKGKQKIVLYLLVREIVLQGDKMESGFSQEWIEKLKANNDIVTTISKYITLQRKGRTYWACCPFHYEKTPSFAVNEYEQYYHCFGCGASGDVIKFVEKYENVDFFDACKTLAESAGMELPEYTADSGIAEKKKKIDRIYSLLRDTARYYFDNLRKPEGKVALDYLTKRNVGSDIITAFGLGYSLGWNEVITYLSGLGYTAQEMIDAGVAERNSQGALYDCYAKRLIFPLINTYGNVIGFSARILEKADFAKYRNTAQTLVFDKSKCLYGINIVKKSKQAEKLNEIIIVEGQMDLIALYKSGIRNAVATMGTALTGIHAKELKRFCDKVVLCFDGDGAGIKATLRSIEILVKEGLQVFVMTIPNGQDPDEYVNQYGKDAFYELAHGAKYWVEYLIRKYASDYDLNKPEEKKMFVSNALNVVKKLETESEQDIYLNLVSELSGIVKSILRADLNNNTTEEVIEVKKPEEKVELRENAYVKAVKFVLKALLEKKEYAKLDENIKENLLNNDYLKVYEYIENCVKENKKPIISAIYTNFDVENNSDLSDLISFEILESDDNERYYHDCVKTFVNIGLKQRQIDIIGKLRATNDMEERKNLTKQLNEITLKLKK